MKLSALAQCCMLAACFFSISCTCRSTLSQIQTDTEKRLPRELRVATVSSEGIQGNSEHQRVHQILQRMKLVVAQRPELVCLPELFAQIQITSSREAVRKSAEQSEAVVLRPMQDFAIEHKCYVVCPMYVIDENHIFNSAVVIDRSGKVIGRYDKVHTTIDEMALGVTPGNLYQNAIDTDIAKLGIQICYDIEWHDGWDRLRDQGAEIIVWPSAFGGGEMVRTKAWQARANVVSSTGAGISRICDCTGDELAVTNRWSHAVVAPINLDRAFLHTWPSVQKFPAIESKYGAAIRIRTFAEEEWSIIESQSRDVHVQHVLQEFGLESREDQLRRAKLMQDDLRRDPTSSKAK